MVFKIAFVITRRDRKGIKFGEKFIASMYTIDLQNNYILHLLNQGAGKPTLHRAIENSLFHILDEITRVLKLHPEEDDSHLSLLKASEGRFKVICQRGIPAYRIGQIEEIFRYGTEVVGVAGRVASILKIIYVPDLSDEENQFAKDWVPIEPDEKKEGSLICLPIKGGAGEDGKETVLGVLSVSSKRTNAFDSKTVPNSLSRITAKVETLIYIMQMMNPIF